MIQTKKDAKATRTCREFPGPDKAAASSKSKHHRRPTDLKTIARRHTVSNSLSNLEKRHVTCAPHRESIHIWKRDRSVAIESSSSK